MKKIRYQVFRYIHASDHYFVISVPTSQKLIEVHGDTVKIIKVFDHLDQAIQFRKAMELL